MPASKDELSALLERVEAATGPSRWLDAAIRDALYAPEKRPSWNPYTASIDSSLALVNEMLPGWSARLAIDADGNAYTGVKRASRMHEVAPDWCGRGPTAALAVLSALFRALIAQAPTQTDTARVSSTPTRVGE